MFGTRGLRGVAQLRLMVCVVLVLGLLGAIGTPDAAQAATLTVTTTTDELNADGDCSLREAVRAANLNTAVDACPAGGSLDTITVPAGTYLLTILGADADDATACDLDVLGSVTITGVDARSTIIDGNQQCTVFDVRPGAHVTITGVTIQHGNGFLAGGIINTGTLTVTQSVITSNRGYATAGIWNGGTLVLNQTTIQDNATTGQDSEGAGIRNSGVLTLNNSTVSKNVASGDEQDNTEGGGIWTSGTLTLNNSSVVYNTAFAVARGGASLGRGGGIYGTFTARNSMIAQNQAAGRPSDCYGALAAEGPNLVSTGADCTITGAGVLVADPLLSRVSDTSVPTPTYPLLPGSPAIDAGDQASCLATDQRGVTRPQDGDGDGSARCDIGAFERQHNLVPNPGFEVDSTGDGTPDGWSSDSHATRSTGLTHSGSYALQHRATDNASYTIYSDAGGPIFAGRVYSFVGWVNIPATNDSFSVELQVRWRDASGNVLSTLPVKTYTAPTSGWSQATAVLTAPPNAAQATLRQVVSSLNATVYVDDLSLRPLDDLVVNGSFEVDSNSDGTPDSWSSNSRATRSSALVHGGSYALRHQATDNASYTIYSDPVVPILPGTTYSFVGWVNIPATNDSLSVELQVRWRDASGNVLSTLPVKTYTAPTSGWSQATAVLTAPPNAAQATLRQVVSSLNATVYVDTIAFGP